MLLNNLKKVVQNIMNHSNLPSLFEAEYLGSTNSADPINLALEQHLVKNETDFHTSASKYFQQQGDLLTAAWAAERAGLQEKADLLREQFRSSLEREYRLLLLKH